LIWAAIGGQCILIKLKYIKYFKHLSTVD